MNREQRRKNNITYTKKDVMKSHESGFRQGFESGLNVAIKEIETALKSEFGFGRKRLARLSRSIKKGGTTNIEAE